MLTIRLQRMGKRNRPDFRIVVAPKTSAAQKKFTEVLGSYNPRTKAFHITDQARLQHWLDVRTSISPTVQNLLVAKGLVATPKTKAFSIPKKPAEDTKPVSSAPAPVADVEDAKPEPEIQVEEEPVQEVSAETTT